MTYPDTVRGALYEAFVDPGKGLAAAKRDYWYERFVSRLEDRGIDEVDLKLAFPDPDTINPFFYLPRFHVELSPHMADSVAGGDVREPTGTLRSVVGRLTPPGTTWFGESNLLQIRIHGNKPKNAYENASAVFERWLHDLEERGFTVHKDYEFPRGLRDEIDEADRRPW